jgi:pyruvate dehydrogenase E1 component alpha subunit
MKGDPGVVLAIFGDGGTSQGDFHEALNLAGVMRAPIVFLCQNNGWAISTTVEQQTASETLAQKAVAYGFPGVRCDGNDLFAVYAATRDAVKRARAGEGPTLIEAVTYRLGLHTTADDPTRYEPREMHDLWVNRDPLLRMQRYLKSTAVVDDAGLEKLEQDVREELRVAWDEAVREPAPDPGFYFGQVHASAHGRLQRQLARHRTADRDA